MMFPDVPPILQGPEAFLFCAGKLFFYGTFLFQSFRVKYRYALRSFPPDVLRIGGGFPLFQLSQYTLLHEGFSIFPFLIETFCTRDVPKALFSFT